MKGSTAQPNSHIYAHFRQTIVSYLDRIAGQDGNRSGVVEKALRDYMNWKAREARDRRDQRILNENARSLNEEAEEVLSYQVEV